MKGWISLHRKILESDIWVDEEPFDMRSAWVDLLLMANHKDNTMIFDKHKLVVERGQIITSVRKLSARWRWSKDRTLRYLRLLEELEMIHRDSNSRRTLLTVVNYGSYQGIQDTCEDTNKDSNKDTHKDTHEPQTIMINNVNNDNNNKRCFVPPSVEEVREYCQERKNNVNPESFVDFYTSKGWKVGSNPMKDWKACVRTWEKRETKEKPNKFINFQQREHNDPVALEKAFLGVK